MDAVARHLRLRNKPVLGVVKEVGLVIEPPEFQRLKRRLRSRPAILDAGRRLKVARVLIKGALQA
jgi:hypothetical protein